MSETGWRDSRSPEYQQDERDNSLVKEAFAEYAGPHGLYRSTYRYTSCGPTVGMTVRDPDGELRTLYGSDLPETWEEFDKQGLLIVTMQVSSIVEGIDACTGTVCVDVLDKSSPDELRHDYWAAVEAVNLEAEDLWADSHGCPECARLWLIGRGEAVDNWQGADDPRWNCGDTQIHPDCTACYGSGTVI